MDSLDQPGKDSYNNTWKDYNDLNANLGASEDDVIALVTLLGGDPKNPNDPVWKNPKVVSIQTNINDINTDKNNAQKLLDDMTNLTTGQGKYKGQNLTQEQIDTQLKVDEQGMVQLLNHTGQLTKQAQNTLKQAQAATSNTSAPKTTQNGVDTTTSNNALDASVKALQANTGGAVYLTTGKPPAACLYRTTDEPT